MPQTDANPEKGQRLTEPPKFHDSLLNDFKHHQANKEKFEKNLNTYYAKDIKIHPDSPYHEHGVVVHNRCRLENIARKRLPVPQMKDFERDIVAFEKQSHAQAMAPDKVAAFYDNVSRLLTEKSMHYTSKQRTELALQLVHHSAKPESVVQGAAGTCNVASIEYRLLSRAPEAVAKMTADVTTNGNYVTADGTKLSDNWHSIKPEAGDRERGTLDKLVQTTLVNCHWERVNRDDNDAPKFRFEHSNAEMADRLAQYDSGRTEIEDRDRGLPENSPKLNNTEFRDIYNQVVGSDDQATAPWTISNGNPSQDPRYASRSSSDDTTIVNSKKDLREALQNGQQNHLFPMEIDVHTGNAPFKQQTLKADPFAGKDSFGWHAISIKSYDEKSGKVKIHNSWGADKDVPMSVDQLYTATMLPPGERDSNE